MGCNFFKNSLRLYVNAGDLLSSGSDYHASSTANTYAQFWTPTYGRFFQAGVQYVFRKAKK